MYCPVTTTRSICEYEQMGMISHLDTYFNLSRSTSHVNTNTWVRFIFLEHHAICSSKLMQPRLLHSVLCPWAYQDSPCPNHLLCCLCLLNRVCQPCKGTPFVISCRNILKRFSLEKGFFIIPYYFCCFRMISVNYVNCTHPVIWDYLMTLFCSATSGLQRPTISCNAVRLLQYGPRLPQDRPKTFARLIGLVLQFCRRWTANFCMLV